VTVSGKQVSDPSINRRPLLAASLGIEVAMLLIAAWGWAQLPPGADVPIHWNAAGVADEFAPKELAFLLVPAIGLGVTALFWAIPSIEPRRSNLAKSRGPYAIAWSAVMLLLLGVQAVTVLAALGSTVNVAGLVLLGVGGLFIALGAVMPRVKSNFLFGIRTPWTLTSERSWERTQRAGGIVFVVLGVAFTVLGIVGGGSTAFIVLFVGMFIAIGVLVAYSYVVWRDDPNKSLNGRIDT
jgi:uncharacterized membrane protein